MKKDEIIELLKEQIAGLRADNDRLLLQVEALTREIASLNEALLQKGESLSKQQRIAKGLAKLMSNSSEKKNAAQIPLSDEEQKWKEEETAATRKDRKNNGARRDMHYDMEVAVHDVYPDDPDFKLMSNSSEKKNAAQIPLSDEEQKWKEEETAATRKDRKNNGARRDMHYDMEVAVHDVYPDDPDFWTPVMTNR